MARPGRRGYAVGVSGPLEDVEHPEGRDERRDVEHVDHQAVDRPDDEADPERGQDRVGKFRSCPFMITAATIPLTVATDAIDRSIPPPTTTKNCAADAMPTNEAPFSVSISTGSERNVPDRIEPT